jgi:hypothetical protein
MDVLEIVRLYLVEHGYDGLYEPGECACQVGDLMPCGEYAGCCRPGYRQRCDGTCAAGRCDYHIGEDKPEGR